LEVTIITEIILTETAVECIYVCSPDTLCEYLNSVRFDVLTAVNLSVLLFWVVMLCGPVGRYQRFRAEVHAASQPRRTTLTSKFCMS
jgi:hypothetical protein